MKLVLIDDEPFHLIGMQTVIPWEQSQFIIAGEARSGEEGIELILREQPDIAIVDIVMPGIDGLEMIRRVKDAAPETRFIVLSCMNDIQRYKEAVSLGAAEYLQKDLATPDVLLETVRRVAQQLKRERLRNSDGEAHADTAPQLLRLYPVGEVSAQLGYTSVSHFVSIFSEETGLTPYRFKRQSQPDGQEMP